MLFSPPLVYGHQADPVDPPSLISCHFSLHDKGVRERQCKRLPSFFWANELGSGEYERILPLFRLISRLYRERPGRRYQENFISSAIQLALGAVQDICLMPRGENFDERVEAARMHLEQNPLNPKSFSILAKESGVGRDYFAKLFRMQVGVAPKRYILQIRMDYARFLLSDGSDVKQVSALLGYSDPFVFSRLFKSVYGVSPSAFKSKYMERPD